MSDTKYAYAVARIQCDGTVFVFLLHTGSAYGPEDV